MIRIYNSLTGRKEPLQPIEPGHVRMYVCGVTVYDYCHVGHARCYVVFDTVVRYLRWRGYKVTYVRNVTDIDDKIIRRAAENDEPVEALTERYTEAMREDFRALGILPADVEPTATGHVPQIIDMIESLIERGHAYAADNGDVYYRVSSFADYGRLSGKRPEDLRAGARVEVSEAKEDPLDFVLWKAAKPGEPAWDSPWGQGRPGWHIECSAMSTDLLGNHFDIHGGGMDLKFPHHENEIAQSCGATGDAFVNQWMHNGFVQVDEEKMSKSLGNFFTIRDVLGAIRPNQRRRAGEILRYFVLMSHYRSPINYSDDNLAQAKSALDALYAALQDVEPAAEADPEAVQAFQAAMDDDFNTAEALAVLKRAATALNSARGKDEGQAGALATALRVLGSTMGLLERDPRDYFQGVDETVRPAKGEATVAGQTPGSEVSSKEETEALSNEEIETLIERRNAARKEKDWAEADRIRDELAAAGVVLEDGPSGTTWKRA